MRLIPLLMLGLCSWSAFGASDKRFVYAAKLSAEAQGLAMLVMIEGVTVFEDYPNGGGADRATELASGTKSFCGVLALCAVEDGWLSLDERVSATIEEWKEDEARREITVRQLLTLTSGLPGGESALRGGRVPSYAEATKVNAVAPPGTKFSYGPNPFQLFGEIMRRKLAKRDETVAMYLERKILQPIGVKPGRWRSSEPGQPHLPSGAALTARDWAKFGEAIRLDAKGILPPGRVQEIFAGTAVNPGYGLTWWLPGQGAMGGNVKRDARPANLPRDVWMAAGAGGQRLVVVPSLKLVAVRQAPVRTVERSFNDTAWLRALVEPLMAGPKP